jgi:glycosyltransferase involved in cell wall biosynthesis
VRIVQLVESLELGGLERMALDLALALKSRGHEPSLWCLFNRGALAQEAELSGIEVRAFQKPAGFSLLTLGRLAGQLRRERPDVLHTHNLGTHVYGAPAAALARVPVVVSTRHGYVSSEGRPYREDRFRKTLPMTDAVVAVSEHTLAGLRLAGSAPERKSRVIYNGIRAGRFLAQPAFPGTVRPRLRLGTVGRLVPAKGHAVLLSAFAAVSGELPEAQLFIAGDGPLRPALEDQASRLGLVGRVFFLGARNDVAEFLSGLDLFVFPSINEGLPLAVLEALAAGLPIVATRAGGVPEVAPEGDLAWYCQPGDDAGLAAALRQAAAASDLAERGLRARARCADRYTLEAMCRSYEDLYLELRGAAR